MNSRSSNQESYYSLATKQKNKKKNKKQKKNQKTKTKTKNKNKNKSKNININKKPYMGWEQGKSCSGQIRSILLVGTSCL